MTNQKHFPIRNILKMTDITQFETLKKTQFEGKYFSFTNKLNISTNYNILIISTQINKSHIINIKLP